VARNPDPTDGSARAYLAPADLREHALPAQAAFGFHRGQTEELLNRAADTIERLNRELAQSRKAGETWQRERDQLQGRLDEEKTRAELLVGEAMLEAHKAGQSIRAEAEAAAEALRAEAAALLEPAKQEAERLVAEARTEANQRVTDAEAECVGLAAQAEQYKLLIAAVQQHSVDVLQRALAVLGEAARETETSGSEVIPSEPGSEQSIGSEADQGARSHEEYLPEPQPHDRQDPEPTEEHRDEAVVEEPPVTVEAAEPTSRPVRDGEMQGTFAKDPMTRLWQNAEDRNADVEAFEAIRARLRD
jgi:cell division septum initiation protein DivIVA